MRQVYNTTRTDQTHPFSQEEYLRMSEDYRRMQYVLSADGIYGPIPYDPGVKPWFPPKDKTA